MSTNQTPKTRKAGAPVYAKRRPKLELVLTNSVYPTTDLITELSHEVKVMPGEVNRKHEASSNDEHAGRDIRTPIGVIRDE